MKGRTARPICPKCKGLYRHGFAMQSTLVGVPDFPGADVVTVHEGGPGMLVPVWKCKDCGHSVRRREGRNPPTGGMV